MNQKNIEAIKRCASSMECVPNCPYFMESGRCDQTRMMRDMLDLMPNQGEWIPIQIGKWRGHKCSCCGTAMEVPCSSSDGIPQWKYCHECGSRNRAKMGVQE